jgi:hypothetical protein
MISRSSFPGLLLGANLLFGALSTPALARPPFDPRPIPPIARPPIVLRCADLRVVELPRPTWDATNHRSIIPAVIRNTGNRATGGPFAVSLDGTSQSLVAGPLAAGASVTVTFTLPYWVYDPDASYSVTVDPADQIAECNESNNTLEFFELG